MNEKMKRKKENVCNFLDRGAAATPLIILNWVTAVTVR